MASTPPYVELHCHSAYSFLDGVSLPEELVARAIELGYDRLALTDHNSVSGSMEFTQTALALGLRPIHGTEIDLDDGRHLTLLVADARGWRNLCRLLTLAHAHDREGPTAPPSTGPGGRAGGRAGGTSISLEAVLDHAEGLICLTGCAAHGVHDEATVRRLRDSFGPGRLRVELQRPFARHDRARCRELTALARRLGLACVATGDVHAHHRSRAELQDAFVALRLRTTLEASEPQRRGNHSHVLATPQAMARRFADHPDAVRETLRLSERLTFALDQDLGYRYPGAEDSDALRRLTERCRARLDERYGTGVSGSGGAAGHRAALARLEEELRVIDALGLAGFFLLHQDMLEVAREVAVEVRGGDSARALLPPGRGRGSSVSSIVCFLTGLSHIDPIANELLLGRFLHEDLQSLPDIDLDFPRDIREVLIPRIHDRYGRDRAALVAAFPTFRSRGAIRELGKVLGLPPGEIERVARGSEGFVARDTAHGDGEPPPGVVSGVAGDIASALGPGRERSGRWAWLARLSAEAYGLPRHLSQHPGGMVIATRPLIDCCPTVPAAMEGRQMVQWDKDSCADAGFLKIDLLGLGMLSAVERCVEMIARTRGERIDLSRIPFDEPQTFAAIQEADTVGVFQIESRAQMQSLKRTRPQTLDDLTIQVAIVRPGPIQGGAVNPYIERLQRLREDPEYQVPYEHPVLEPVLSETLGTIIFQDQVIEVAQAFAGFSAGEADGLRRAMSRKRSDAAIEGFRRRFVAGAARHVGAEAPAADRVWKMVAGFAGFGFPKSHSAAFGLLAYQSTWLRVHYGPEFLCALLNEQPMGFYASDSLVHDAERRGIAVRPVDVNASNVECTVEADPAKRVAQPAGGRLAGSATLVSAEPVGPLACSSSSFAGAVRIGLDYVKGPARAEIQALVAARERGGPFRSLGDLAARAGVGRPALEQLAWSGACDALAAGEAAAQAPGGARRLALWQLGVAAPGLRVPGVRVPGLRVPGVHTQLALPMDLPPAPRLRPLGRWGRLIADYATSGVTVGDHVMAALRPRLQAAGGSKPVGLATSAQLARLPDGCTVAVAGLVIARQRPGTAGGIVFLLFEDEWGTVNLIVPPAVYERHRHLVRAEPLLLARGRLERPPNAGGVINVLVADLSALDASLTEETLPGDATPAQVHELAGETPAPAAPPAAAPDEEQVGASMRAVAPAVQSFAAGRRR
jgi:error-prone DNA polymerase